MWASHKSRGALSPLLEKWGYGGGGWGQLPLLRLLLPLVTREIAYRDNYAIIAIIIMAHRMFMDLR